MKNKLINYIVCGSFLCVGSVSNLYAQNSDLDSTVLDRLTTLEQQVSFTKPGNEHFLIAGLLTTGFASTKTTNVLDGTTAVSKTNSLGDADHYEFSPMFLWRHGNNFLLEFEPSFNNNGLSVNWANVSYFAAPNFIVKAGYFVLPFGTYAKREAAGWIDKLPTDPMGIADMTPTDYGLEIEGGLALDKMKMNYDLALSNGSQLLADGSLSSGNIVDNNSGKTVTARFGLLPFSNSCLEIGVSGMFGKVGDAGGRYANIKGKSYAMDLNFVKTLNRFLLNIKSQYNIQNIDKANYINPLDSSQTYIFNNHLAAAFGQCSIRPTGVPHLKNFEIAGRYTNYTLPAGSLLGSNQHSFTVGVDYWLSWRSVFKIAYESYKGNSTASKELNAFSGITKTNTWYLQFAIQL